MPYNDADKLVLKLLYKSKTRIHGKTKFQKIMYILKSKYEDRIPELGDLRFRLHYYGPFSRDVDDTLKRLTFRGHLLTEKKDLIDYVRYDYMLSGMGEFRARKAYELENHKRRLVIKKMAKEVKKLNGEPLDNVIAKAYSIAEEKGL